MNAEGMKVFYKMKNNTILLILFLFITCSLPAQDKNNWGLFRGDAKLSGVTSASLPSTLDLLWSFKTGDNIKSSPVVYGDKIVIGSTDGWVYALTMQGALLWKFNTTNSIEAPAMIVDGIVYCGNLDGALFAIDLNTGKVKWKYKAENQIMGSPNLFKNGGKNFIVVGSYDYNLHCVDALTGKLKWKYETGNYVNGCAAINNNYAIFGGCDGFIHVVNVQTGKLKEKINVGTYIASSATVDNNRAYAGDYNGKFSCIGINEKKILWKYIEKTDESPFIGSPALYKNYVVVGNRNKFLYCFDKNNGKLLWRKTMGGQVDSSPVIAGDKIIIATMKGDIKIIQINDGKQLLSYELGSPVSGCPAVVDQKIILGADDGKVYCLGKK